MRVLPAALAILAAAAPSARAWEVSSSGKGGDYVAHLPAMEALKGPGETRAKPTLTISCQGGQMFAAVAWPAAIPLNEGQHFVSVGWDLGGEARRSPMRASPDEVSFSGSAAKEWLRLLSASPRLSLSVPDAQGGQTANFDLAGAPAVQAGIAGSGCG
jgi:hypothetical protein